MTAEHEAPLRFRARRCPYPYVNEAPLDRDAVYHVWLWFVLDPESGGMKLERYPEAQYRDNEPAWMEEEELTSLLCVEWHQEVRWMQEEGIAPGQPFLVRIRMPYYSVNYWGEGDVDYRDIKILWRRPLPRACALKRWVRTLRKIEAWKAVDARLQEESKKMARVHVGQMRVHSWVRIGHKGYKRRFTLISRNGVMHETSVGEETPYADAVDKFVHEVLEKFPHMWEGKLRRLIAEHRPG